MKILAFGGWGQFGSDLVDALDGRHELVRPRHEEADVRDSMQVARVVDALAPDVVVNAAAFHKVELCEEDPDLAFAVNATGAGRVAEAAREAGARCVFLSTDYVFDGTRSGGYREDDAVGPLNVYGTSKVAGENMVRNACPDHLVVRVSGLFGLAGSSGKGGNFVETMLAKAARGEEISVVDDQIFAPTSTRDLAERLVAMLEAAVPPGIYHGANSGSCSWYEFARKAFELAGVKASLTPRPTGEQPLQRPAYSVLVDGKGPALGLPRAKRWDEVLEAYLRDRPTKAA